MQEWIISSIFLDLDNTINGKLKIVHISTYINGGAGIAAYRIHEALVKSNVDSHFLCTDQPADNLAKAVIQFQKPAYSLPQRACRKFRRALAKRFDFGNFNGRNRLKFEFKAMLPSLNAEFTGLPFSDFDLLSHPLVNRADIIHLHWVSDFLDYPSFFKYNQKPVVWTLHDMNPIMGIYHYEADRERNLQISIELEEQVALKKRKFISQLKAPIRVIAPSRWLQEKAAISNIFQPLPVSTIPYALDTDVFFNRNTIALRQELNIPAENTIFLFVAQNISYYRKGFDLLIDALKQMANPKITLLIIGYSQKSDFPGLHCIHLGSIKSRQALSYYYSLADAFILPSREDNLPNVMLESLACGTPVIAFETGGMSEIIQNGITGLKSVEINSHSLKNILEQFLLDKDQFNSEIIRQYAVKHFNEKLIAAEYLKLYNEIASS